MYHEKIKNDALSPIKFKKQRFYLKTQRKLEKDYALIAFEKNFPQVP